MWIKCIEYCKDVYWFQDRMDQVYTDDRKSPWIFCIDYSQKYAESKRTLKQTSSGHFS